MPFPQREVRVIGLPDGFEAARPAEIDGEAGHVAINHVNRP